MGSRNACTIRRMNVLQRILSYNNAIQKNLVRGIQQIDGKITIDDVTREVNIPKDPQFVPQKFLELDTNGNIAISQTTLHHLRWMLQKDRLGQDMFLLGRPGPLRRSVAMQFLQLTQRELEYVALSRDTTESDLKQRREIQNGTAIYFDQSAVRAATNGRILVIEGVEKAERNVLPVLNNLLENREMHLEDGRFLIPADRYDKLLQEHGQSVLEKWGLVRVSEDFRVIALGLPVPKYRGSPLDPPLRSRFQARDVTILSYQEMLKQMQDIAPNANTEYLKQIASLCYAIISSEQSSAISSSTIPTTTTALPIALPDFPADSLLNISKIVRHNTNMSVHNAIYRLYPYRAFLSKEGVQGVLTLFKSLNIIVPPDELNQKIIDIGFNDNNIINKCIGKCVCI